MKVPLSLDAYRDSCSCGRIDGRNRLQIHAQAIRIQRRMSHFELFVRSLADHIEVSEHPCHFVEDRKPMEIM